MERSISQELSDLVGLAWDLAGLLFLMVTVTSLTLVAIYELRGRASTNREFIRSWEKRIKFKDILNRLNAGSLAELPFRQLIGQIPLKTRQFSEDLDLAFQKEMSGLEDVLDKWNDTFHAADRRELLKAIPKVDQLRFMEALAKRQEQQEELERFTGSLPDMQIFMGRLWFRANATRSVFITGALLAVIVGLSFLFQTPLADRLLSDAWSATTLLGGFMDIFGILSLLAIVFYLTVLIAPLFIDLLERFILAK